MLCAVTGVAQDETIVALRECTRQVAFGDAVLLSQSKPIAAGNDTFRWQEIAAIESREAYSRFICGQLAQYCTRSYVLLVQWDGFIIDPLQWDDGFLDYDYIGAPWPQFDDDRRVGNGGFSLRSRRLLEIVSANFEPAHPEDVAICRDWRGRLEEDYGIKFAPETIAGRFARERHEGGEPTFGFHGLFLFPEVLPTDRMEAQLADLEGALLTGRDGADLLVSLVRRGRYALAMRLFGRRFRFTGATRQTVALLFRFAFTVIRERPVAGLNH